MKAGRFQMAEESNDIAISVAPDEAKTNGGGMRNLTVKTYRNAKENSAEAVLPHHARTSSGSCHDICKYGIKHVYEDKKKRPALRRVSNQMPNEERSPVDVVSQEHGRKNPELKMRSSKKKHEIMVEQKIKNQKDLPPEKIILLSDSQAESFNQKSSSLGWEMTEEHSPHDRYEESSEGSVIKCMISSSILGSNGSRQHESTKNSKLLLHEPRAKPNGNMVKNRISSEEFVPDIQVQKTSVAFEGTNFLTSSEFPMCNLAPGSLEETLDIELIDGTTADENIRFGYHAISNRTKETSHKLLVDTNLKTHKELSASIQFNNHSTTAFGKAKLVNLGRSTKRGLQMKSNILSYRRSHGTTTNDAYKVQAEGQLERFSMSDNGQREMSKISNAEKKISDVTGLKILKNKEVGKAVKFLKTETGQKKPSSFRKSTMIVNHTMLQRQSSLTPRKIGASAKTANSMKLRKVIVKSSFPSKSLGEVTGPRLQTKMDRVTDTEQLNGEEDISVVISTVPTGSQKRISDLMLKTSKSANPELALNDQTKFEILDLKEKAFCVSKQIPAKLDIVVDMQNTFKSPTGEEENGVSSSKFSEMKEGISSIGARKRNSSNLSESKLERLYTRSESNQLIDSQSVDQHSKPKNSNCSTNKIVDFQPENNNSTRLSFRQARAKEVLVAKKACTASSENMIDADLKKHILGGPTFFLRHQGVNNKKETQGLFNQVIEETASKLEETQKSKVKALVGAFETVISLQENKAAF